MRHFIAQVILLLLEKPWYLGQILTKFLTQPISDQTEITCMWYRWSIMVMLSSCFLANIMLKVIGPINRQPNQDWIAKLYALGQKVANKNIPPHTSTALWWMLYAASYMHIIGAHSFYVRYRTSINIESQFQFPGKLYMHHTTSHTGI